MNEKMKKFQNQGALAIITKIKKGEMHSLRCLLKKMVPPHSDVEYNDKVPFAKLITIHMARFVVVDKSMNECAKLGSIEPFLLLTTNYDYPLKKHLKELVEVAGKGLDEIYSHCEGYPDPKGNDNGKRLKYLKKHMTGYGAFHNGTVGLSVKRIREESNLRDEIEDFIDKKELTRNCSSEDAQRIRKDIKDHIGKTDFSWALTPPDKPPLSYLLFRGTGWRTLLKLIIPVVLLVIIFVKEPISIAVFIAILITLAIFLRFKEKRDIEFPYLRYDQRAKDLAAREDKVVLNQMTILDDMKPGLFRLLTLKFVFTVIEFAARYLQTKGKLGGIPSIHFARWILVNNNKGLMFLSNYDESWENYLGDFVDKASTGLNAIWSNSVLYPKTHFLIKEGAADEQRFKVWARWQQMPTDVWYTAYKTLTVKNILNNKEIRKGLSGDLTNDQALEWLRRL